MAMSENLVNCLPRQDFGHHRSQKCWQHTRFSDTAETTMQPRITVQTSDRTDYAKKKKKEPVNSQTRNRITKDKKQRGANGLHVTINRNTP